MAISTMFSYLMYKATESATSYSKLVDIKSYPDLGGSPETIEVTTLSDWMQKFVDGVQSSDSKQFTANYDKDDYSTIEGLEGTEHSFSVWLGGTKNGDSSTPTGAHGKFSFKGKISVYVNGGDVNAASEMTITIVPTTAITMDSGS